ncbi:MAG: hypothetical protein L0G99_11240, partial [Propionibacteriales bacterium]|nr:hypothetical protein [Propionibacteriales bacterium]
MSHAGVQWRAEHRRSIDDPEGFWAEQARAIDWFRAPQTILDRSAAPQGRWFTDGVLNTCYNALDRHVIARHADHIALVHHSAITGRQ